MANSKIKSIKAREILDSRGYPTLEVNVETDSGVFQAGVPAGTSKGANEALELRDGGQRYQGMGVSKAIGNVNKIIAPKLKGKDPADQKTIDDLLVKLDGTENKSKLGANAISGVSMAVCRAGAASQKMALFQWLAKISRSRAKLPKPCLLYLEGGAHGRGDLDTQEFMMAVDGGSFREQLRQGTEIYHDLRRILRKKYPTFPLNVGLEGGFTPPVQDTEEALCLLMKAAGRAGGKIKIILDMAASTFFRNGQYYFEGEILNRKEMAEFYSKICKTYPIMALEDPFAENDWEGWKLLDSKLQITNPKVLLIGDDLTVTNPKRIKVAAEKGLCNGVIIKPNQIGTVSETIEAAKTALKYGWQVFVKHRSGETTDTFISDLATGLGIGFLMAGAPHRGERVAKYNHLLRVEEKMKNYG